MAIFYSMYLLKNIFHLCRPVQLHTFSLHLGASPAVACREGEANGVLAPGIQDRGASKE